MSHILGDHNRSIVELYIAEFVTDDGNTILECWGLEPSDAAKGFREFFSANHPDRMQLVDRTRLDEYPSSSEAYRETWAWWMDRPVWTGEYIELVIDTGTRVTVGKTIIEYFASMYHSWSKAYKSKRSKITQTQRWSLRTHAIQERAMFGILERQEQRRRRSYSG